MASTSFALASLRRAFGTRSRSQAAFWRGVPSPARLVFLAGVFWSFVVVGFVVDILALGASSPARLAFLTVSSGSVAVLYAVCAFRSPRMLFVAVAVHVAMTLAMNMVAPAHAAPLWLDVAGLHAVRARLGLDAIGCIVSVVLSYAFFVAFISKEGQRYLRVHTEMVLAGSIHRSLVRPVDQRIGRFRFHGWSVPSGQVGGDLVDLVETNDGWVALVADVSGHGVPSGVLTAMVKSAARMRLRAPGGPATLLTELNETLVGLIEPNMFVTCTCVAGSAEGPLTLAAAGHPPVLHLRASTNEILHHNTGNLALGIFAAQPYECSQIELEPGDVLVLLTDGLLEVFDESDAEFGLAGIERVLREHRREPAAALANRIRAAALAHGSQMDDQTLLLISMN
jgi:hypothetical protein